jgi:hypothetical protein
VGGWLCLLGLGLFSWVLLLWLLGVGLRCYISLILLILVHTMCLRPLSENCKMRNMSLRYLVFSSLVRVDTRSPNPRKSLLPFVSLKFVIVVFQYFDKDLLSD